MNLSRLPFQHLVDWVVLDKNASFLACLWNLATIHVANFTPTPLSPDGEKLSMIALKKEK